MTKALDRVDRKGLVEGLPNPADRRGGLVSLTETRRTVVDEAMNRHAATERRLLSTADDNEPAARGRTPQTAPGTRGTARRAAPISALAISR
jgi:DNA-binding MarR family transcriptional regulator